MGIVTKLSLKELNMYEQEYLWKYLSLDKFVSILENNGLYFTTIHNLKQNIEPDENSSMMMLINYKKKLAL